MFISQIQHLVQQMEAIVHQLTDDDYSRPLALFNGSSIGKHTRHVIEFFVELEKGYEQGFVDYDNRQRNKVLETNKASALALLAHITSACDKPDKPLQLAIHIDALDIPAVRIASTYHREMAFTIEHTVHHMALIRIGVLQIKTVAIPESFGVATSTQRYQNSCVQ